MTYMYRREPTAWIDLCCSNCELFSKTQELHSSVVFTGSDERTSHGEALSQIRGLNVSSSDSRHTRVEPFPTLGLLAFTLCYFRTGTMKGLLPVVASIQRLLFPATPLSPELYKKVTPIIPNFPYSLHCRISYAAVSSTSCERNDVLMTFAGLTIPQLSGALNPPGLVSG